MREYTIVEGMDTDVTVTVTGLMVCTTTEEVLVLDSYYFVDDTKD